MLLKSENSFIKIDVTRRSYPNSNDYWDGNWLESEVKIEDSGFKSSYRINLRSDDFQRFYEGLIKLENNQSKEVEFTTMEEGLYLKGVLEITGNIKWESIAKSDNGNILKVFFETKISTIDSLIVEINNILNTYPVVGNIN